MLKFTPKTQRDAQAELLQRIQDLDDWQARLVLSFIENLFYKGEQTPPVAELEVAA